MLLRCPSCSARYEVAAGTWPTDTGGDGSLLLRARKVRCRRCQEVWLATPEAEDDIIDPGPPLAEPVTRPVVQAPVPALFASRTQTAPVVNGPPENGLPDAEAERPRRARRWPWLVAAVLLAAGGYGAVATDRLQPEAFGLPPLAPWAKLDLSSMDFPAVELPSLQLPAIAVPAVTVPQAPPPKLTLTTDATTKPIPGGGTVWDVTGAIANPTRSRLPIPPIELELLGAGTVPLASWSIRPPAETLAPGATIAFATSALNPPAGATRLRVTLKPASLARL